MLSAVGRRNAFLVHDACQVIDLLPASIASSELWLLAYGTSESSATFTSHTLVMLLAQ